MSRWATAWRGMKPADTVDSVDTVSPRTASPSLARGLAPHIVNRVNSVTPLPDHQCDAPDIRAEPALPPRGTPERDRLDRRQAEMVRGLLTASRQRPTSWADPAATPTPGCRCRCCDGARWWCERTEPKGWRCWTCHPPTGLDDVTEART